MRCWAPSGECVWSREYSRPCGDISSPTRKISCPVGNPLEFIAGIAQQNQTDKQTDRQTNRQTERLGVPKKCLVWIQKFKKKPKATQPRTWQSQSMAMSAQSSTNRTKRCLSHLTYLHIIWLIDLDLWPITRYGKECLTKHKLHETPPKPLDLFLPNII